MDEITSNPGTQSLESKIAELEEQVSHLTKMTEDIKLKFENATRTNRIYSAMIILLFVWCLLITYFVLQMN